MTKPIIQIKDLKSYFKTSEGLAKAVDGVSFHIQKGETYALVGESGCGKSVTALSILQLLPKPAGYIAGGSIDFKGEDIAQLPGIEMRRIRGDQISMIFQEPMTALNPVFTIGYQISEAILLHQEVSRKEAQSIAIDMLSKVGIPDAAARYGDYPHQMSGGMRQRVMIAMALSCKPELLIADEPTTALDVTIQSQILKLIRELKDELNTAVLLITHDMAVVRENADRVGVMYAGKLVEESDRDTLFKKPIHPYTRLLLRSLPSRSKRNQPLATIEGMVPKATHFPTGCRFSNRCPFAMTRCRDEQPPQYAANEGHNVSCFLLDPDTDKPAQPPLDDQAQAPPSALDRSKETLCVEDLAMHFPIHKGVFQRVTGHVKAVDGVDLVIHKGETLALVGESGCGKTTVGKCLVRLYDPSSGTIFFEDREITHLSGRSLKPYRQRIQMVFQDPFSSLNPRMMIGDTITEGMTAHGLVSKNRAELRKRAQDLLERVGLDRSVIDRYPHEFSGGQRQRIGVARALAVEPSLLICDEATSALDVSVQAQILNLLKELQSELGLSYLFITHDLSVVRYLADRVSVMYLGRIVEEGTTADVFEDPKHPYTQALLSAVPQIDEDTGLKRIILEGDVPSPIAPPPGCHFHPRCPKARPECSKAYPGRVSFNQTHSCHCVLYGDTPVS